MREKLLSFNGANHDKWDHPRECGKNHNHKENIPYPLGSPPRVREKLTVNPLRYSKAGITPASAGKTAFNAKDTPIIRDHPRECGKNQYINWIISLRVGSPPRVREKHDKYLSSLNNQRITPASAGKTQ